MFLYYWYLFVSKSFLKCIVFLKRIIRIRKINIFLKVRIIHFFTNFLTNILVKNQMFSDRAHPKIELAGLETLFPVTYVNLNCLIVFFLSFFKF